MSYKVEIPYLNKGIDIMKGKPVIPPVYLTATYKFNNSDELIDVVQNRSGYIYSRWDNPTVNEVEKIIAEIEGYQESVSFSSGMAAITTSLLTFIKPGDRIVTLQEIYGESYKFFTGILAKFGVETAQINCDDQDKLFSEIEKGLSILYLETPTNPLLRVIDIKPLADAAHKKGAIVMLDSTFASPINQRPVELGIDIALHSATKYLSGHHDVTAGFACGSKAHIEKIWGYRKTLGGCMDPMTAFLTMRGIGTLEIRIERQNENAQKIAEFLNENKKVETVNYPGLPSHPARSGRWESRRSR